MLGLLFQLMVIASLVVAVWAMVDAAGRPKDGFNQIDQNKAVWIALPLVGIVIFAPIGGIVGLVYLRLIRRKVVLVRKTPLA
jgi:hypothetical protein